jgi:hypothetical protein
MRPVIAVIAGLAALAVYSHVRHHDHTRAFISCLERSGGTLISRPGQLRGYPASDVESGAGVAFPGLAYESIDVAVPRGRRALVFVSPAGAPAEPAARLRQARAGRARARAVVLMPPARDPERQIGACEERADPGEDYP